MDVKCRDGSAVGEWGEDGGAAGEWSIEMAALQVSTDRQVRQEKHETTPGSCGSVIETMSKHAHLKTKIPNPPFYTVSCEMMWVKVVNCKKPESQESNHDNMNNRSIKVLHDLLTKFDVCGRTWVVMMA